MAELMVGSTPLYCWSQLALYHLQDKLTDSISTSPTDSTVCALSVLRRQYLAYYAGCPNETPPFDVT